MPPEMQPPTFRAAAVQMASVGDKTRNLAVATRLTEQAADDGAQLVVFPEYFNFLGRIEDVVDHAESIPGPTSEAVSNLAAQLGIWLVAGSICEQAAEPGKGRNTSLVFDRCGNEVARYRKMHLFNIDLPEKLTFAESDWVQPGDTPVVFDSPFGRVGLATCYDLRFPELFRVLIENGMELLAFPSAFFETTGRAHWEVLLRARAIENQVPVIASNQATAKDSHLSMYGHSVMIDAWGAVLASAGNEAEAVVAAQIDRRKTAEIRRNLPALEDRKIFRVDRSLRN